ncbi:N-acetylneuraminate synthase family protein [Croceiramulus getboli]|nr:N-acetylneuraminate synthase family protein [Flavobacteriaceae bacterium YJPT1-3]
MPNPFLIAEIAQAHGGEVQRAHDYIDALAKTGVDAVKFQTHIAAAESSVHEPFRVKFSEDYATRFEYWKAMEFTLAEWKDLKSHCDEVGVEFMSSPFSNAAVDLLEEVGVQRYKVGSGEVNNFLLMEKIAQTGKPLILSSGMSSLSELDQTTTFLRERNVSFSLLQCTTKYPTEPADYGLDVIQQLKERYHCPVGYSDHSAQIATGIAAVALGAEILEFHAVFDRANDPGPDASSSLEMEEISQLVHGVRRIALSRKRNTDKSDNSAFQSLKSIFEKSLAVNKALSKGHVLTFEDLEAKKPKGYGIDAADFQELLGKKLKRPLQQWDFLNKTDIEDE